MRLVIEEDGEWLALMVWGIRVLPSQGEGWVHPAGPAHLPALLRPDARSRGGDVAARVPQGRGGRDRAHRQPVGLRRVRPREGRRLRPGGEVEHGRAHAPHRRLGAWRARGTPGDDRPLQQALRRRAHRARQPGLRRQGNREDEGAGCAACRPHGDHRQRVRIPRPAAPGRGPRGGGLLHKGLRIVRERRHRELQPPRQAVVPEGHRLQPRDAARDPGP